LKIFEEKLSHPNLNYKKFVKKFCKKNCNQKSKRKKEKKPIEELATGPPSRLPATSPAWRALPLPPPPAHRRRPAAPPRRAAQELGSGARHRAAPQEMPELASAPHLPAAARAACRV